MPAPKQPYLVGALFAEQIIRLVAELRFYLGGENYTSGRYKSTHSMLFALEEHLRALDLDGPSAGALLEANPRPVSELMFEICRATERVAEVVDQMKAVANEAGAGGRNGGAAAAAQEAVARWLAAGDNAVLWLWIPVGTLATLCQRGKPLLDSTRRRVAELELLKNREPALPVPPESVEHAAVCGGG
ncbi:unnamed protein product [Miscanthus lutarioriparius]|uniref:Uncharacterized protein n=1 Tax=Miscanthus lutarioriparius TaxID=422564 RepID=A0A811NMH2_9POAL|nr:unnamed protein product [Miscanthus lutarioriparius]